MEICSCGCGYSKDNCVKKAQKPVKPNQLRPSDRDTSLTQEELERLRTIAREKIENPNNWSSW